MMRLLRTGRSICTFRAAGAVVRIALTGSCGPVHVAAGCVLAALRPPNIAVLVVFDEDRLLCGYFVFLFGQGILRRRRITLPRALRPVPFTVLIVKTRLCPVLLHCETIFTNKRNSAYFGIIPQLNTPSTEKTKLKTSCCIFIL